MKIKVKQRKNLMRQKAIIYASNGRFKDFIKNEQTKTGNIQENPLIVSLIKVIGLASAIEAFFGVGPKSMVFMNKWYALCMFLG